MPLADECVTCTEFCIANWQYVFPRKEFIKNTGEDVWPMMFFSQYYLQSPKTGNKWLSNFRRSVWWNHLCLWIWYLEKVFMKRMISNFVKHTWLKIGSKYMEILWFLSGHWDCKQLICSSVIYIFWMDKFYFCNLKKNKYYFSSRKTTGYVSVLASWFW